MGIAKDFIDNAAKVLRKPVMPLLLAGSLLSPLASQSQTRDKADKEPRELLDSARRVYAQYNKQTNHYSLSIGEAQFADIKMSRHYKKTRDNPDIYTTMETLKVYNRGVSDDKKVNTFWIDPSNSFHVGAGYNFSDSPFEKGSYFEWGGTIGVFNPRLMHFSGNYRINSKNPYKNSGTVIFEGDNFYSRSSFVDNPASARAKFGINTPPTSNLIAKAGVGVVMYLGGPVNFLETGQPFVDATVGVSTNRNKIVQLSLTGNVANTFMINKNNFDTYITDKKSYLTYGVQASLSIVLGNAGAKHLKQDKQQPGRHLGW